MRRIIIIFVVLILAILSGVFLYFYSSRWEPFRCNTHIKSHINIKDGQKLELNLDINAIAVHEGSSELLLVGSLKGLNQDYVISRRVFLSIKQSDFNAFTNTMISRENAILSIMFLTMYGKNMCYQKHQGLHSIHKRSN